MKRNSPATRDIAWLTMLMVSSMSLSACSTRKPAQAPPQEARNGEVSESIIEPEASSRYVLQPGMSHEAPVILGDYPLPEYPARALAARLPPIEVTVRIVVDEEGLVTRIDPLGVVDDSTRAFYEATSAALSTWEFAPLRIVEVATRTSRPMPFHQDYRFVFRQIDGVPQVKQQ